MSSLVPLWKLGEVNPATPELQTLADGAEVTFMPLEAVWPGKRADYSRTIGWSKKLSYTSFRRGDVLIPKITPTFEAGRSIVATIPTDVGLATTEVHVVRPHEGNDARFLCYAAQSLPFLDEGAHSLQGVGNLRRITPRFVQEHQLLDASPSMQRAIADYLDRETGEIDAMLGKMDDLAGSLRLRYERAVEDAIFTSEHRASLGYVLDCLPGFAFPSAGFSSNDEDVPLLRGVNVKPGGIDWSDTVYWPREQSAELKDYALKPGDIVLGMDRPFVGSGTRVVQIATSDPYAILVQRVLRVRTTHEGHARFVYYVLKSRAFQEYATPEFTGISVPHISEGQIRGFRVPLPALDEQIRIADHLDEVTGKIEAMLAKVAELKSLLIERRAALITDVVTGKKEIA